MTLARHHQGMKKTLAARFFTDARSARGGVIYCARRELCEALFEQGRNI